MKSLPSWGVLLALTWPAVTLSQPVAPPPAASASRPTEPAQPLTPAPPTFGLAEAVARAMVADPAQLQELMQARAREELGAGQADAAWKNPTLRFRNWQFWDRAVGFERAGSLDDTEVAVRWTPPVPGVQSGLAAAGQLRSQAATLQGLRERQIVADLAARCYFELLELEAKQELAHITVQFRQRMADLTRLQAARGVDTALTRSAAELDALEARAEEEELVARRLVGWQRLATATGLTEPQPRPLDRGAFFAPCGGDPRIAALDQAAMEQHLEQRPDLAALQHEADGAGAEADAARIARWPWPRFIELGYARGDNNSPDALQLELEFPLPLFDRQQGALAEQTARQDRKAAERHGLARIGQAEAAQALAAIQAWRRKLAVLAEAEPVVIHSLSLAEQAVAANVVDLSAVATLKKREQRLQETRLEALLECRLAELDLWLALGQPILPP